MVVAEVVVLTTTPQELEREVGLVGLERVPVAHQAQQTLEVAQVVVMGLV
jgi:hypothetical protein